MSGEDRVGERVTRLETWREQHEREHRTLDGHIATLAGDITEIRAAQGAMATKDDVAGLRGHIDGAVNGLLRDALNAIPGRQAVMWTACGAVAAVAMALAAVLR